MRITNQKIITAIVAVLTLAGLGLGKLAYKMVCVRVTDWWAVPGTGDGLDPEAWRGRQNDEQFRAIRCRIEAKNRLAGEVIDGRLTLLEAAARFRDLDREPPPFAWDGLRISYPGASDDELHCAHVTGAPFKVLVASIIGAGTSLVGGFFVGLGRRGAP